MSRLASPPTHAKLGFYRTSFMATGAKVPTGVSSMIGTQNSIHVVYAYGTVGANGEFIADPNAAAIHTAASPNVSAGPDPALTHHMPDNDPRVLRHQHMVNKVAAIKNLQSAGAVPMVGSPHVQVAMPGKPANFFRQVDLDAYFSVYEPRLRGTVE